MSKPPKGPLCKKVVNPCKICLQSVTVKNGVQCQGACEAWVHFTCLNYTPGKIKDIQAGFIAITCPCPDCKTTVPKEYRTNEPFACNNVLCPANNPPACEEFDCQANEQSRSMPPRCPPPGTLRSCGINLCRDYSGPNAFKSNDPCMEGYILKTNCGEAGPPKMRLQVGDPNAGPIQADMRQQGPAVQGCQGYNQGGMQGMPDVPRGMGQQQISPDVVQQMCRTVGDLAQQLNSLMDNLKGIGEMGPPISPMGGQGGMNPCGSSGSNCGGKAGCKKCGSGGGGGGGGGGGRGGGRGGGGAKKGGCTGGCGTAGQSGCAQPCHCPGNPVQKHR